MAKAKRKSERQAVEIEIPVEESLDSPPEIEIESVEGSKPDEPVGETASAEVAESSKSRKKPRRSPSRPPKEPVDERPWHFRR